VLAGESPRGAAADPPGFNPRAAGKLVLWLDGAQRSSLQVDGDRVGSWLDLSGHDRHARQADALHQPLLRTGALGGKPTLLFDAQRFLQLNDDPALRPEKLSLFIVCRSTVSHAPIIGYPILAAGELRDPYWRWVFFHNTEDKIDVRIGGEWLASPINVRWGEFNVYGYRSWSRDVTRNGHAFFRGNSHHKIDYPPSGPGLFIGKFAFNGEIAEILLYDGDLSDHQREKVEQYLLRKWGIKPE
jgi:hypothetical protein